MSIKKNFRVMEFVINLLALILVVIVTVWLIKQI